MKTTSSALAALLLAVALPALAQEAAPEASADPTAAETNTDGRGADPAAPAETAAAEEATVQDMALGAADAPVTVIEYGSLTCPHCAAFHADQFQQIKQNYIDSGQVRFVFREVYFDRPGLWASMVARCGGEMRFFGIVDMLYDDQRGWIGGGEPAEIAANLRTVGRAAGMDDAQLDTCLSDQAAAEALVGWYEANAAADGIEATPTFIIDGEKHSNMSYEDFAAIIDAQLAESQSQ